MRNRPLGWSAGVAPEMLPDGRSGDLARVGPGVDVTDSTGGAIASAASASVARGNGIGEISAVARGSGGASGVADRSGGNSASSSASENGTRRRAASRARELAFARTVGTGTRRGAPGTPTEPRSGEGRGSAGNGRNTRSRSRSAYGPGGPTGAGTYALSATGPVSVAPSGPVNGASQRLHSSSPAGAIEVTAALPIPLCGTDGSRPKGVSRTGRVGVGAAAGAGAAVRRYCQ
jgi:hypothetical protein